jgi:hypothetical protein
MHTSIAPSKLTKLAVMLLTIPVCGAYAAYDYSSTLDTSSHFSANLVTQDTLDAANVTKAGTSLDPNSNYIGWSVTPTQSVFLYWNGTTLTGSPLTIGDLTIGNAITASATASSSFNTLTIADYVTVEADSLTIGKGALVGGSGANKALVDTTKPADGNAVTITGAAYQSTAPAGIVATTLDLDHGITVGAYGNNNSLGIASGAHVTANDLISVGDSDANNSAYGNNNSVTIGGKVSVSVVGYTGDSAASLTAYGAYIGSYGSGNKLTISDSGVLNLTSDDLAIGIFGSNNAASATDAFIVTKNNIRIGIKPSATGNSLSLANTDLSKASAAGMIEVGKYGSTNSITVANSTLNFSNLNVGYGDDNADKNNGEDGTEGYVASEGGDNTLSVTDSTLKMGNELTVGYYGSGNTATISGSSIYKSWTDAAHGSVPADGVVQMDEITAGIASITVGHGQIPLSAATDYTALGCNNTLTIDNASVFRSDDNIVVGEHGSGNALNIQGGSLGYAHNGMILGNGDSSLFSTAYGSGNAVEISGENTALQLGLFLSFGANGSYNTLSVENGAALHIGHGIFDFGTGAASTETVNNSAFGRANTMVVANYSTLTIGDSDGTSTLTIGNYGSYNILLIATYSNATFKVSNLTIGSKGVELGNVLAPNKVFSESNALAVTSGSTLNVESGNVYVGREGTRNIFYIGGKDTQVIVPSSVVVGVGSTRGPTFGSYNMLMVQDEAVLETGALSVGSMFNSYAASNNQAIISSGAIVVVNDYLMVNSIGGENNVIRLNGGKIALKGKGMDTGAKTISWADYILNGYDDAITGHSIGNGTSLVDEGSIEVWNESASSYVKAKKSDISLKYYSSEAEAVAATGYAGLAGYSVLAQTSDLSHLAWAGEVYDAGSNVYCSPWYGWFYCDAAYGNWIMSYNDYAWQYVAPDSTPDSTYIYDTKLGAWLFTNQTYFEKKWVYNYAANAWQKLGE